MNRHATIETAIEGVIDDSPSLKHLPVEALSDAWIMARRETAEQILDFALMSGEAWHPDDMIRD